MKIRCLSLLLVLSVLFVLPAEAAVHFLEAEDFEGGWSVVDDAQAREASSTKALSGASGDSAATATATVSIKDAGRYFVWVRYSSHPTYRGPFRLDAFAQDRELGGALFDEQFASDGAASKFRWEKFELVLPEGEVTLRLGKHENKNCSWLARLVDCVLLTMDPEQVPDHSQFGAQTYLRVTLGEIYERPAYVHLFADHYRAPWYAHWSLGSAGPVKEIRTPADQMLAAGESTPWCNLTPTIYQDSGAMLYLTVRHGYTDVAPRLKAVLEISTTPDESGLVRRYKIDNEPGSLAFYLPPHLLSEENRDLLKSDIELAEEIGKQADSHPWPTHGKPPVKFPFFVTAPIERKGSTTQPDRRVVEREKKTLAYFGFNEPPHSHIGGAWFMKEGSYCLPDLDKMREKLQREAAAFKEAGGKVEDIRFCEVMDEPTGQPLEQAAAMPSYTEAFRAWLKGKNMQPSDLLVGSWDDVVLVTPAQREALPALYYFSQLFRTRALGDFMATQGKLAKEAYGGDFPVLANFSDGAVYGANFFLQGVDYFELLDADDQNAIWGEDWANGSSSYQCASFNVDLMRAAARERGQFIAHHLIAHSRRKPWDIKLKATSEAARGVKLFNNFAYGPLWATHEGGPWFRTHLWQAQPHTWTANAALTREFGAAEDLLLPAMPAPAKVALLYSSASDAWTVEETHAHGFDRMHTWMALAHAQTPVDVVAERQVERGLLTGYEVCYLSGPNLTRAAAVKLREWVEAGGALHLAAGAASRDEYNRPLDLLDDLLPAVRGEVANLQPFRSSGRYLSTLQEKDTVAWPGGEAAVLGVKQTLTPKEGADTLATFSDGSAAVVRRGQVTVSGFLPALAYIKTALDRRKSAEEAGHPLTERSSNPWEFPAPIRELILQPASAVVRPVECSHPLVDAVYLPSERGIVIPLANYTLEPIGQLELRIRTDRKIRSVETSVLGTLDFRQGEAVTVALPLDSNDFLMLWFE